jgi:hypothetical protein
MSANGVGEAVGLADGLMFGAEGRRHAVAHSYGPTMLLFDDIEGYQGTPPRFDPKRTANALCQLENSTLSFKHSKGGWEH